MVFFFWVAVCYYSTTYLDVAFVVFYDKCSDNNVEVHFVGEVDETDGSGVEVSGDRFNFVNDFHGSYFGAACYCSAGKHGLNGVEDVFVLL